MRNDNLQKQLRFAEVALNRAVDLAVAGKIAEDKCEEVAKQFYLFLQSLTQISEAEVIHKAIKAPSPFKGEGDTGGKTKGAKLGAKATEEIHKTDDARESELKEKLNRIRELVISLGWVAENKVKFTDYLKANFHKEDIHQLTDGELTTLKLILQQKVSKKRNQ